MPGRSRTPLPLLIAALVAIASPTTADAQSAPAVIHACYVPLTGTVYRIKEPGLRTACSSGTHVEFSWTDGSSGGGVTGYEVVTKAVTHSYGSPFVVFTGSVSCPTFIGCTPSVTYLYRTTAAPLTTTFSCPAGKKVFGVFGGTAVGADVLQDGSVSVTLPEVHRDGPSQTAPPPEDITVPLADQLPNNYPGQPSTAPDNYSVKLVCANAS